MENQGLSEEERQVWEQLAGQLSDVHVRGTHRARRHVRARLVLVAVLFAGTLGALWWWPLVLCFPVAAWTATLLWEQHGHVVVEDFLRRRR